MSIRKPHLKKVIQVLYLPDNKLKSALRSDINTEAKKVSGENTGGGGDFHSAFWSDAKKHAAGLLDLRVAVEQRIADHKGRRNLYPLLQDGYLKWWDEKRRWSNEEFSILPVSVKGTYKPSNLDVEVKVENLLTVKVGEHSNRLICPYFSESPVLSPEAARIGLWLMNEALDGYAIEDMRILDVLRSESFSVSDYPLHGDEEQKFREGYKHILTTRGKLLDEYK